MPGNDRRPNAVRYLLYLALNTVPLAYLAWIIPQLLSTISTLGQTRTAADDSNFFDPSADDSSNPASSLPSTSSQQQQKPFLTGSQRGDTHVYLSILAIWLALTIVLFIGTSVIAFLELARRTPRKGFGYRTFVCSISVLFMLTEIFVNVAVPKRVTATDNVVFLFVHLGKDCVLIILSILWQFTLPGSSTRKSRAQLDDRESARTRPLSTSTTNSLRRSTSSAIRSPRPLSQAPPSPSPTSAGGGGVRTSLVRALSTRSKRESAVLVRPTSLVGVPALPMSGAGEHQMSLPRRSQGSGGGEDGGNVV